MITTFHLAMLRGRARWAIALAVAVATLVVADGAPADAAPPTLTATENPVMIPVGASTKPVTLGWNLNGYQGGVLVLNVQEDGGPVVLSLGIGAQTGSTQLTARYPKSYTVTLSDLTAGKLSVLEITTNRAGPALNSEASQSVAECVLKPCITSVTFSPHGSYAEFAVKTTKAATFQMAICAIPFRQSGACSYPVSGMFNTQFVTNWQSHVTGLTHHTAYHYLVTATDASGNETTKSGAFRTLRRKVEVTVDEIAVTNDSDDHSECDCSFDFEVEGQRDYWPGNIGGVSIGTGEAVNPPLKVTVLDAPDTLRMRLLGRDNDRTGSLFQVCAGDAPVLGSDVGSNACWDWATATETFNVAATGFGEEFGDSFCKRAEGGPLTFRVKVSFTVTYVP